jgi:DNA-binding IclR family transcriptional regulator
MKTVPAADDASRDPELRGEPLAIYRYLLDLLDMRDWHEVKRLALSVELGIGRTKTAESLDLLVRLGYIELDAATRAGTGQARRYRLHYRRHPLALDSRDPAA